MSWTWLRSYFRVKRLHVAGVTSATPTGMSDGDGVFRGKVTCATFSCPSADTAAYATAAERAKFNIDGTNPPTCEALRMQDSDTGDYYRFAIKSGATNVVAL